MFYSFYNELYDQIIEKKEVSNANHRLFKVNLSFNESKIKFTPDWDQFQIHLYSLFSKCKDTLNKFKRLLDPSIGSDFNSYVDLDKYNIDEFKNISSIYDKDPKYKELVDNLIRVIKKNWDKGIKKFSKEFNEMQQIFKNVMNFKVDDLTDLVFQESNIMSKEQLDNKCDKKLEIVSKIVSKENEHQK